MEERMNNVPSVLSTCHPETSVETCGLAFLGGHRAIYAHPRSKDALTFNIVAEY